MIPRLAAIGAAQCTRRRHPTSRHSGTMGRHAAQKQIVQTHCRNYRVHCTNTHHGRASLTDTAPGHVGEGASCRSCHARRPDEVQPHSRHRCKRRSHRRRAREPSLHPPQPHATAPGAMTKPGAQPQMLAWVTPSCRTARRRCRRAAPPCKLGRSRGSQKGAALLVVCASGTDPSREANTALDAFCWLDLGGDNASNK